MENEKLTREIIGCAMTVHRILGPGFLEAVYQNALAHELRKSGMPIECESKIQVRYDGAIVGNFSADMLVNQCVLVENKAVRALAIAHEVQLVNYLTATGIEVGLLLNFGANRLEFKRKTRTYCSKESRQDKQDERDEKCKEDEKERSVTHPVNEHESRVLGKAGRQDLRDGQDVESQVNDLVNLVHPVKPTNSV